MALPVPEIVKEMAEDIKLLHKKVDELTKLLKSFSQTSENLANASKDLSEIKLTLGKVEGDVALCKDAVR